MALTQTQVSQLYVSIFNRASEGEGNTNWQTKGTMAEVANLMLETPDAKTYFGSSLSNQEFIETIYKNTLNKTLADDEAGIANWTAKLDNGMGRGEVVAELIEAIYNYAPGGSSYNPDDQKTINAYNQFINRVEVSNYMAIHVEKVPADYKTTTQFAPLGELVVTDSAATVTTAKTSVDALKPVSGQTFSLTAGVDTFTGTDKADLFKASLLTVNDGDTLDGGAGVDTLNAEINAAVTDKFKSSNIEKVNVTSFGAQTVDMKNITGVETITTKGSTGALTLNNVATSTVGFGFEGSSTNDIKAIHVAGALAGTNDILNVNLNGAKDVKLDVAAGFESAKITTAGTNDVKTLTAPGVATYTVEGTGSVNFDNTLTNVTTLSATNNSGAITTGTVDATGFAANVITAGANGASVLLGAGNDNIGFTTTASKSSTIKLGAGDDKLLLTTTGSGTYVFGEAGNDTIKAKNGLTVSDLIDGGEGTDTLVLDAAANTMVLRGVEKLTLTNTATGANVINSADSAIAVTVEAGTTGAGAVATGADITGLTSGSTVTVNDAKDATLGVADIKVGYKAQEAAATVDVNTAVTTTTGITVEKVSDLTLDFAKAVTLAAGDVLKIDDTTKLTIKSAKAIDLGDGILSATTDKLESITVTGSDAVDTGAILNSDALKTVNVTASKAAEVGAIVAAKSLTDVTLTAGSTATATLGNIGTTTKADAINAINVNGGTVAGGTSVSVGAIAATNSIASITVTGTEGNVGVGAISTDNVANDSSLGTVSLAATKGTLTAAAITSDATLGTVTLTSTAGAIAMTDGAAAAAEIVAADTTGITVNMTAKGAIDSNGDTAAGSAAVVENTGGNITASVAGTTVGGAKVDYTAKIKGVVNLTATNTGGLTSIVTNAGTIADALTSTITLGNAVTNEKNNVTIKDTVATLNVTGGTGEDNIILNGAQVKSGTISLGTGTDSVSFDGIISAADVTKTDKGVVINLGSTAYKINAGEAYETSVAAGHAVEYNALAGTTAKKLVTDGFDLTLSGVEKVTGTANADIIIANAAGSTIDGGAGNDYIVSGAGSDKITVGAGNNTIDLSTATNSTAAAADTTVKFDVLNGFIVANDSIKVGIGADISAAGNIDVTKTFTGAATDTVAQTLGKVTTVADVAFTGTVWATYITEGGVKSTAMDTALGGALAGYIAVDANKNGSWDDGVDILIGVIGTVTGTISEDNFIA